MLGTKLLGWKHIGYVEFNEYCQQVIRARIDDGYLDEAPIFTDVREFLQSGAAREYRGFADVVTAGFPCQPFSVAGKRQGENDERNMWPATRDIIREVRPRYAFLENVPGLLTHGYIREIFADLAKMGMDAKWGVLGARHIGDCHNRDRLWIVAANTNEFGKVARVFPSINMQTQGSQLRQFVRAIRKGIPATRYARTLRNINELAGWVDRHKAIGNGQHARVAATAWQILTGNKETGTHG